MNADNGLLGVIDELKQQLAAMTQERDTLDHELKKSQIISAGMVDQVEEIEQQLAASQAREQQLREALKALQQGFPQTHQINAVIRHAIALPQDDTSLKAWGAKLLREMANEYRDIHELDIIPLTDLRRKADELENKK